MPQNATASSIPRRWPVPEILVLLLGIALRLTLYLSNNSFWIDEAHLAKRLLRDDFWGRIVSAGYGQTATPAFAILSKIATLVFGNSEFAFRAIPLLAGIAALFFFRSLSRLLLPERTALLAQLIFAFTPGLVYYSAEFKPYSVDLLFSVVLLGEFLKNRETNFVRLSALGCVAILFSNAAVFVLAAILLNWFWEEKTSRKFSRPLQLTALWGTLFCLQYFYFIHRMIKTSPIKNLMAETATHALRISAEHYLPYPITELFAAAFILLGAKILLDHSRQAFATFALVFCAFALATRLGFYPEQRRVLLALAPITTICLAAGVAWILTMTARHSKFVSASLLLLFISPWILKGGLTFYAPPQRQAVRQVLQAVQKFPTNGQAVYSLGAATSAVDYYQDLTSKWLYLGSWCTPQGNISCIETLQREAPKNIRTWVIISSFYNDLSDYSFLRAHFLKSGELFASIEMPGAAAYLVKLFPTTTRTTNEQESDSLKRHSQNEKGIETSLPPSTGTVERDVPLDSS